MLCTEDIVFRKYVREGIVDYVQMWRCIEPRQDQGCREKLGKFFSVHLTKFKCAVGI